VRPRTSFLTKPPAYNINSNLTYYQAISLKVKKFLKSGGIIGEYRTSVVRIKKGVFWTYNSIRRLWHSHIRAGILITLSYGEILTNTEIMWTVVATPFQ
jgi:hypothetical protein